jgi:tetratricopeptide (TPR) repeat protein
MNRRLTQLSTLVCRSRRVCVAVVIAALMSTLAGCGPNDPIQEVRERLAAGDVPGSLDLMRELVSEDADNPELLFIYAQLLVQTGQPGLAEWPLRKVMQDPVWFKRAAALLGSVEQAGGNFENAAAIYAEILEANPDDLNIRIRRANACAKSPPLFEEALAEVDRILERAPDELGAFKPRILAYLGMNRPEEAGKALEELGVRIDESQQDDNPISGWHCATMAIFASDSGDTALAQERWATCEEKFPTHSNVVSQSIEFHKSQGDLEAALKVAEVAFAAEPAEGGGYRLITAELLRLLGRPDEAESVLLEGVALTDDALNQSAVLLALTEHYKAVGNLKAAAEQLETVLEITRKSIGPQPDLLFSLAELLVLTHQQERALELTEQMTVAAHRSLVRARVAHDRKQYAKALKLYSETSRLWPQNAYAPYHEARAAMSAGLFDRAFKSYLLSIRVDDAATDARIHAARLMVAEGQLGSALEMLGSTRIPPSLESDLLTVEIVARTLGPVAAVNATNRMSQRRPAEFGQAIAAAARGASAREDSREAWTIIEPKLALDLPPNNHLPILRAAVKYAPGDVELAVTKPLVERAVESRPDAPYIREIEGMFFERSGARAKAVASYRQALGAEPGRVSVMLKLARVTAKSEPQQAIELIEGALQAQASVPQTFDPELFLTSISELAESPEVEALLESALELAPANGAIAYRLATSLEANGGDAQRVVRLATWAIRFQVATDEATALRDRAKARL